MLAYYKPASRKRLYQGLRPLVCWRVVALCRLPNPSRALARHFAGRP